MNGIVDAADYTLWRNNFGSAMSLPNDPTLGVGQDDYQRWKDHFGQTAGSGVSSGVAPSVPEPTTLVLIIVTAIGMFPCALGMPGMRYNPTIWVGLSRPRECPPADFGVIVHDTALLSR